MKQKILGVKLNVSTIFYLASTLTEPSSLT
jgi:hypothetical protein